MLKLQFSDELTMIIKDDYTATVKFNDGIFFGMDSIEELLKALNTNLPQCVVPIVKNKLAESVEYYIEGLRNRFDCSMGRIDTHAELIKDDE